MNVARFCEVSASLSRNPIEVFRRVLILRRGDVIDRAQNAVTTLSAFAVRAHSFVELLSGATTDDSVIIRLRRCLVQRRFIRNVPVEGAERAFTTTSLRRGRLKTVHDILLH